MHYNAQELSSSEEGRRAALRSPWNIGRQVRVRRERTCMIGFARPVISWQRSCIAVIVFAFAFPVQGTTPCLAHGSHDQLRLDPRPTQAGHCSNQPAYRGDCLGCSPNGSRTCDGGPGGCHPDV